MYHDLYRQVRKCRCFRAGRWFSSVHAVPGERRGVPMSIGLGNKFNILQQSPLDLLGLPPLEGPADNSAQHWIPSWYNVRATAEDGRLVLWNTLSGKLTVFGPQD